MEALQTVVLIHNIIYYFPTDFPHSFISFTMIEPERFRSNFTSVIFKLHLWIDIICNSREIVLMWMLQNPLQISQHQFMYWQQAITWANVNPDQCHYMASLDHNELMYCMIMMKYAKKVSHKFYFCHDIWHFLLVKQLLISQYVHKWFYWWYESRLKIWIIMQVESGFIM